MRLNIAIILIAVAGFLGLTIGYHVEHRDLTPKLTDAQVFELMKIALEHQND